MSEPTKDQIAQFKQQYGEINIAAFKDERYGTIIVRKPSQPEFADFTASGQKQRDNPELIFRRLVLTCAVFPDRAGMEAILIDLPALGVTLGNECVKLAGGGDSRLEAVKL